MFTSLTTFDAAVPAFAVDSMRGKADENKPANGTTDQTDQSAMIICAVLLMDSVLDETNGTETGNV